MVQIKDDEPRAIGKKDFEDGVKSFLSYLCFAILQLPSMFTVVFKLLPQNHMFKIKDVWCKMAPYQLIL